MAEPSITVHRVAAPDAHSAGASARARWQVRVGGTLAGSAEAGPAARAQDRFVRLEVDPPYRGAGVGSALARAVAEDLAAERCDALWTMVVVGTEGEAFARRYGAEVGDELVDDVLHFDDLDSGKLQELATADRPGYELAHWCRRAPDDIVASYARAKRRIADAPNAFPPPVPEWDTARVREWERSREAEGSQLWVGAALVAGRGAVAAFSEISLDGSPDASQEDTAVLPEHRRHGLATSVKADLVLRVRQARPDLRTLSVTCAVANTGMREVNRRLGFREQRRRNLVRLPLDRMLERLLRS